VAVVGGGNTAAEDALFLSKYCPKVYIIHRRDQLTASKVLQNELFRNEKIKFIWNSVVESIVGDSTFEGLRVKNIKSDETELLHVDGLFVAIGNVPNTGLVKGKLPLSENGYIITNEKMQTNIPGAYAAGDVRDKDLRQVITAAADGAIAAHMSEMFINDSLRQYST
jgi:thioredoxin reductase (NADPH)